MVYTKLLKQRRLRNHRRKSNTSIHYNSKLLPYVSSTIWYDRYSKTEEKNLTVYITWKLCRFRQIVQSFVKTKDVVYVTADTKYKAVREDVLKHNKQGRPILIGTMSILQSETVARYLDEANITYQLLNAKAQNKKLI